jgi:hypothetical protein
LWKQNSGLHNSIQYITDNSEKDKACDSLRPNCNGFWKISGSYCDYNCPIVQSAPMVISSGSLSRPIK